MRRWTFVIIILISCFFIGCTSNKQKAEKEVEIGDVLGQSKDYIGAIKHYTKAIELNPKYAEAYLERGLLRYGVQDDQEGALEDLNKAAELGDSRAYNNIKVIKDAAAEKNGITTNQSIIEDDRPTGFEIPKLQSYVNDYAGIMSSERVTELNTVLKDYQDKTSTQIFILTVPDMNGAPSIEAYSLAVANKWKPGQKGKDNGVLLTVTVKEKQVRIEVGLGLESVLTNAECSRIINDVMVPTFREGSYDKGIHSGVKAIIDKLTNHTSNIKEAKAEVTTEENIVAISSASYNGNLSTVNSLIKNGVNINMQGKEGRRTVLGVACQGGHIDVVKAIIRAGASVNTPDNGTGLTPLMYAAGGGHKEIVKELIKNGANVNYNALDANPNSTCRYVTVAGVLGACTVLRMAAGNNEIANILREEGSIK